MSEIRETTTVEDISIREPEAVRTIAQLLAGMSSMTRIADSFQRTKRHATLFGKTSGIGHIASSPIARLQSILRTVQTAGQAASLVAQQIPLQVEAKDAERWEKVLQESIRKNDIPSLVRAVGLMAQNQQKRIQQQLISLTASVLSRRGFSEQVNQNQHGIIVAKKPGSTQMMTVEVALSKNGTIGMHYDLDGFHGGSCIEELNGVQSDLAALGVKTATTSSRRKDPRRAFDGRRMGTLLRQSQ